MRLPAGRFHQFLGGCPAWPFQQVEDLGGLAAVAGAGGFRGAFGRILRGSGLLPRLALLWRDVGATRASGGLLGGFPSLGGGGRGGCGCFCVRDHRVFPLSGDYRVTWITLDGRKRMRNLAGGSILNIRN